ncbi:MAG: hypothetical protein WKF89_05490 [Chitinophagaceae bacterium]
MDLHYFSISNIVDNMTIWILYLLPAILGALVAALALRSEKINHFYVDYQKRNS